MIKVVDLVPYPRKLFLVKKESRDKVEERFTINNSLFSEIDNPNNTMITFSTVVEKDTKDLGFLVYFGNTKVSYRTFCHEAVHVAIDLFRDIREDVTYECQEPFAYLVEYIFECIRKFYKE